MMIACLFLRGEFSSAVDYLFVSRISPFFLVLDFRE